MSKKLHENFNISIFEEPIFQQEYTGLRQGVDSLDFPVAAIEPEENKWIMNDLITLANADIINSDVIKIAATFTSYLIIVMIE